MDDEQRHREELALIAKYPDLDNLITFLLRGWADPRSANENATNDD